MAVLASTKLDPASDRAFGLATSCLSHAALTRRPTVGVAMTTGDGVCLGARVHAGRVLAPDAFASSKVVRRSTAGPAFAYEGGAVVAAIALPSLVAVHRDATAATFVNRNVRPLLRAMHNAGIRATYLGRDWISAGARPLAQLGVDGDAQGALVIEAWLSARRGLEIPTTLLTDLARATTVRRGLVSTSIADHTSDPIEVFGARVLDGLVNAFDEAPEVVGTSASLEGARITSSASPLDADAVWLPPREVPIGYVDVARHRDRIFLGGDVLARVDAADDVPWPADGTEPILGASWADLADIARRAR